MLLAVLGALGFATLGIWGKLAADVGLNPFAALTWRFLLVALILLPMTWRSVTWEARGRMLRVGLLYGLATTFYFAALERITVGTTSLLLYLAPAFIILFSWIVGHKPSYAQLGERKEQTLVLDMAEMEHLLGYNPLERKANVPVAEQVSRLLLAFKRVWADSWGARMEDIPRHTLALLIEHGLTLREFERVLVDADFSAMLLEETETETTSEFFYGRYNIWNSKER